MKRWAALPTLAFCLPLLPQAPSALAGTWNVTATDAEDSSCEGCTKGDRHAYLWLVNVDRDGTVLITVQGTTGFPRLAGHWEQRTRTLLLNGYETQQAGAACWFKLKLGKDGVLRGVRRFTASNLSPDGRPCFSDYEVVGRRP